MEQLITHDIIDFIKQFGLFRFLLLNIGFALFWIGKIEEARSERRMKNCSFNFGYLVSKHWPSFLTSFIVVWLVAPIAIVEWDVTSKFGIIGIGATGGLVIQKAIQIPVNYFKSKK